MLGRRIAILPLVFALLSFASLGSARSRASLNPDNLGNGVWIACLEDCMGRFGASTTSSLAQYIKDNYKHVKWVAIKASQGNIIYNPPRTWYDQFDPSVINAFLDAGLDVFGYVTILGGTDAQIAAERQAASYAIASIKSIDEKDRKRTGIIVVPGFSDERGDPYAFNRKARTWAEKYMPVYGPADKRDYVLGYAAYPDKNLHSLFPYDVFESYSDVAMPMAWWLAYCRTCPQGDEAAMTLDMINQYWATNGKPVAPIGQIVPLGNMYQMKAYIPQIGKFTDKLKSYKTGGGQQKYKGMSIWMMDQLANPNDKDELKKSDING